MWARTPLYIKEFLGFESFLSFSSQFPIPTPGRHPHPEPLTQRPLLATFSSPCGTGGAVPHGSHPHGPTRSAPQSLLQRPPLPRRPPLLRRSQLPCRTSLHQRPRRSAPVVAPCQPARYKKPPPSSPTPAFLIPPWCLIPCPPPVCSLRSLVLSCCAALICSCADPLLQCTEK